jgi:hypothetical protein
MEFETTNPTIKHGDVVAWFETVGPERAKQLMSTYHEDYRKYRPKYAEGLARDMKASRWNFDGSPIRVDVNGNLFDGNHRMHAVEMSETIQTFLFVVGLPVTAYNTTDTGLARSYRDNLRRRGYQNVTLRASLIRLIAKWEAGLGLDDTKRLTNAESDIVNDTHVDTINRALELAMTTSRRIDLPASLWAFSWWVLYRIDLEKAHEFLVAASQGEHIGKGDPAYALRNRLYDERENGRTRNELMHLVFQAWNAFMRGEKITRLQFPKSFVSRDKMEVPTDGAS